VKFIDGCQFIVHGFKMGSNRVKFERGPSRGCLVQVAGGI
jgi:hypothetical protein